jgi:cell division protein FtsB
MLSNRLTPILSALILLALFVILSDNDTSYIKEYEDKIEALHQKIDSLHGENDDLRNEIKLRDQQFDSLEDVKQKIKIITREKVINIGTYTLPELQEFFTKRYSSQATNTSSQTSNN